nr:integrase, catalytic region, zinc finger, CCHC-type, peptidase aspartic, catalytic [Tanacetum cinerariifolium]
MGMFRETLVEGEEGVNSFTDASGSQPRSNTKKNRISPAKRVNKKKVEANPRINKSSLKTMNRVDSSISSNRNVIQIVLWYWDSGCLKHMTEDRSQLRNFVKKFIRTVRIRNDHFGAIMCYEDYVIGDSVISRVYYVEGLGHYLFSVRKFCDFDLEVAFRKHSCYVRDTYGVELTKGSRSSNLYTISVEDMLKSSPICLLSKASKNKSWLWHRRLNHLNFDKMADENIPAPAPTRSNDQILPFAAWDKTGAYRFQLDKDWFRLDTNLVREDLEITPVDQAHQFVSPPLGDVIMDFVNQLGYPGEIHFVSRIAMNNLPRYPVLQMLWGIITRTNIDYAELIHHNIHKRSGSPLNFAEDDPSLGNLKIAAAKEGGKKKTTPKADKPVKPAPAKQAKPATAKQPKPKLVKEKPTKHTPIQKAGKGKVIKARLVKSSLQLVDEPDDEQDQPKVVPKPQGASEEFDLERAIQTSLESFQAQGQEHVGGVAIREPVAEATCPLPVIEGKEKAIATEEQAAQSLLALHTPKRRSTTDQFIFQRRIPATKEASTGPSAQPQDDTSANIVCETPSPTDAKTGTETEKVISEGDIKILNIGEEHEEDMDNQVYLEEQTTKLDECQAGSDPGKTPESRPPPDDDKMDEDQARSDPKRSHVALAGPNLEPMHDDFVATVYPKVHENLKFLADEQVILEDPPSSSVTLSSMKNLDDTYTFGDQFFNNKLTKDLSPP